MAAGGVVDGQLLGENDINTEPVEAKDATKEKDSKFFLYCCIMCDALLHYRKRHSGGCGSAVQL